MPHALNLPLLGPIAAQQFLDSFPQGYKKYSFSVAGREIRVCHQDPKNRADGVYQEASDKLGLLIDWSYTNRSDPRFAQYARRFRLPLFEGAPLARWHGHYAELFPHGLSETDFQNFNSLLERAVRRGIRLADLLPDAEKMLAVREQNNGDRKIGWKEMKPAEKFGALALVLFLKNAARIPGFHDAQNARGEMENRIWIDSVLEKVQEGKFYFQLSSGKNPPHGFMATPQAEYQAEKNILLFFGDNLLTDDAESTFAHELFHFYQDRQGKELSYEETETAAYLKAAEYLLALSQKSGVPEGPRNIDDHLSDLGIGPEDHLKNFAVQAVFYRNQGDTAKFEEFSNLLRVEVSVEYYFYALLDKVWDSLQKDLEEIKNGVREGRLSIPELLDKAGNRGKGMVQDLRQVMDSLASHSTPDRVAEMNRLFGSWVALNELMIQLEFLARDPDVADPGKSPAFAQARHELYRLVAAQFRPAKYLTVPLDGMD